MVSYKERWDRENTDTNGTTSTWRDPLTWAPASRRTLSPARYSLSILTGSTPLPFLTTFRTSASGATPPSTISSQARCTRWCPTCWVTNGIQISTTVIDRPDWLPLSSTTVNVEQLLLDYGNTTGAGTASHSLTLYRAPSGALVFGAGTVYWSWGLDDNHDLESTPTDPNVQQAMVNLFADMGVQPGTLMASLAVASQSTDNTRPTTTITSPTSSGSYIEAQPITITGTASDGGGGVVAVVEVSTDGGTTWHRATGFENWTYTWTPLADGNYTIRSRAVDDSVNLETPGPGTTITVGPAPVWSLIPQSTTPDNPVRFRCRFRQSGPEVHVLAGRHDYRYQVLQGPGRWRRARRLAVEQHRNAARERDIYARDGERLADRYVRQPGLDHRRHDLCRQLSQQRPLRLQRELFRRAGHQRSPDRARWLLYL